MLKSYKNHKKTWFFQFSRPSRNYYVSEILSYQSTSYVETIIQRNLFQQLWFSKFEWDLYSNNLEHPLGKLKYSLMNYENKFNRRPASQTSIDQFENLKKQDHFKTINQIEQAIIENLQKDFWFEDLFCYQNLPINEVNKNNIIDLYNFMINSQILTKDELFQLLYQIKCFLPNELESPLSQAATTAAFNSSWNFKTAMIGVDFALGWNDAAEVNELYESGQWASNHPNQTFIHEFGHALASIYNLGPDFKNQLNKNIIDNGMKETVFKKVAHHFRFKFPNDDFMNISDRFLVTSSLNFFLNEILDYNDRQSHVLNVLAKWICVPSHYGRTLYDSTLDPNNWLHPDGEWLAEGLSFYFLTPIESRDYIWELWHQFFTTQISYRQKKF